MIVGLINQNHRVAWRPGDELAQLVFRRNARGGVVRITNVDQPFVCRRCHFCKIVSEAARKRHFHDLGATNIGVISDSLECWVGYNHFSTAGGECAQSSATRWRRQRNRIASRIRHRTRKSCSTQLQDLSGAIAEQDLLALDTVYLRDRLNQQIRVFIRVAPGEAECIGHCFYGHRRGPIRIFI